MKSKEKKNEIDINEVAITLEVKPEVVAKVRSGEITHIGLQINEDTQELVLESVGDSLVLDIDEMPTTFHGCYLYNNGKFPYAIKNTLEFLVLNDGEDICLTRIINVIAEPGMRFKYKGAGKPKVENPKGDSCIWEVSFEVVPMPVEPKKYLMRWNPSISSFTEQDYADCMKKLNHGMFRMNWSIREWEEARRGDLFYMMRTGDDKAGIVFKGQFISDPYPGDDWAGTTKRRMYVDLICMNPAEPGAEPLVSLEKLQKAIPEFEWAKGHSGTLLSKELVAKLEEILR